MSMIEDALIQISKNLKELTQIQKEIRDTNRERLELEKETIKENKKGMKKAMKLSDIMVKKGEQVQKDVLEMFGVKNKIDIDGIDLGDDINK